MKDKHDNPYKEPTKERMKTSEDRLRFAIEFAQADIETMREGDQLNLRDDLAIFVQGSSDWRSVRPDINTSPIESLLVAQTEPRKLPIENVVNLQREVQAILALLAHRSITPASARIEVMLIVHPVDELSALYPAGTMLVGNRFPEHLRVSLDVVGNVRDMFLYVLARVLAQPGMSDRVRICPGCMKLFLKVKRQKYCSQRCSNRVYMHDYRAVKIEQISESNHKQYEKRTRAKTGKAVKIARKRRL
jgi:hypothetical protein